MTADQIAAGIVAASRLLNIDPESVIRTPLDRNPRKHVPDNINKARQYVALALLECLPKVHGQKTAIGRCLNVTYRPKTFVVSIEANAKQWWRDYIYRATVDAIREVTPPPLPPPPVVQPDRDALLKELAHSVQQRDEDDD